jgi:hypothetical protein
MNRRNDSTPAGHFVRMYLVLKRSVILVDDGSVAIWTQLTPDDDTSKVKGRGPEWRWRKARYRTRTSAVTVRGSTQEGAPTRRLGIVDMPPSQAQPHTNVTPREPPDALVSQTFSINERKKRARRGKAWSGSLHTPRAQANPRIAPVQHSAPKSAITAFMSPPGGSGRLGWCGLAPAAPTVGQHINGLLHPDVVGLQHRKCRAARQKET